MKLYVASSWRNPDQPGIVAELREQGHDVYDFRHPPGGDHLGFSWSDVDRDWVSWTPEQYVAALEHPIAVAGFESDFHAMEWAEGGVLVLKCGRSAHLEAGWLVGQGKPVWILLDPDEFGQDQGHHVTELMYRMVYSTGGGIFTTLEDLLAAIPDEHRPAETIYPDIIHHRLTAKDGTLLYEMYVPDGQSFRFPPDFVSPEGAVWTYGPAGKTERVTLVKGPDSYAEYVP